MDPFLQRSEVIDWDHPVVLARAQALRGTGDTVEGLVARCFAWVRDEIKHSGDFALTAVTCRASDVLREGSGYCYAKSHLLAALLRANGVPAGLCYQRLALDDEGTRFCLHGLNAVRLAGRGWYRLDPRGNRAGINAQFEPPVERLAFTPSLPGEMHLPEVWPEPLPLVTAALMAHTDARVLGEQLPDVDLWTA
jgi:transglutaminase-like putative cysteine protease